MTERAVSLSDFLLRVRTAPETIAFQDAMTVIDAAYGFTPAAFKNGAIDNPAGQNSGSCKIFAFGQLHELSQAQTLACFGDYYRIDVLQHPHGIDHGNIRNFMKFGWDGIAFEQAPLSLKS